MNGSSDNQMNMLKQLHAYKLAEKWITETLLCPHSEFAYMRNVTTKVDVFSFGIVVMEFLTKQRPTGLMEEDGLPVSLRQRVEKSLATGTKGVLQVLDPMLASNDSNKQMEAVEELFKLALFCTSPNPEERPNMNEVLSILSKLKANNYENEAIIS